VEVCKKRYEIILLGIQGHLPFELFFLRVFVHQRTKSACYHSVQFQNTGLHLEHLELMMVWQFEIITRLCFKEVKELDNALKTHAIVEKL